MKILDTHALIWWTHEDHDRLGASAREILEAGGDDLFASSVSINEIVALKRKGRIAAFPPVREMVARSGLPFLPLTVEQALVIEDLPAVHKDPFDRLLVSQALHEGATLITCDREIMRYPVPTIW